MKRDKGSGTVRINTTLKPNQDIYALLFGTSFKLSAIDLHRLKSQLFETHKEKLYQDHIAVLTAKNDPRIQTKNEMDALFSVAEVKPQD